MAIFSGALCEVCDRPVILFLLGEEGVIITVECQRCGAEHNISFGDLIDDVPHFCCGYELLPAEFDEWNADFSLDVVCHHCKAYNIISTDEGVTLLQESISQQEYEVH